MGTCRTKLLHGSTTAIICEEELHRLRDVPNTSREEQLAQEKALAVACATDALARLHNKETLDTLKSMSVG